MNYTREDLKEMTMTDLKALAKKYEVPKYSTYRSANKSQLITKILKHSCKKPSHINIESIIINPSKAKTVSISRKEIAKLSNAQLRKLLSNCGQSTSGNKDELAERVYTYCKFQLTSKTSEPVEEVTVSVSLPRSSKCSELPCTRDEIKSALHRKGINHFKSNLSKSALEQLYEAPRCNPEKDKYCKDDLVCDLRDNVCTNPSFMKKGNGILDIIKGNKVYGCPSTINDIREKNESLKQDIERWIQKVSVSKRSDCKGENTKWAENMGCFELQSTQEKHVGPSLPKEWNVENTVNMREQGDLPFEEDKFTVADIYNSFNRQAFHFQFREQVGDFRKPFTYNESLFHY